MARKFYGVNKEAGHDLTSQVTESGTTTSKHVEFSIDDAVSLTKEEINACARRIVHFLLHDQTISNDVSDYGL